MNLMKYEAPASLINEPHTEANATRPTTADAPRIDLGQTLLRRVPRTYRCYQLPKQLSLSHLQTHSDAFAAGMARCLAVETLIAYHRELLPGVWFCSFWHGDKRKRRLTTYDDAEGMKALWYRARLAATVVFDEPHRLLMASLPKQIQPGRLLDALASLFTTPPPPQEPLTELMWDLPRLLSLSPEACHPVAVDAPWKTLQLKSVAWQDAGALGAQMVTRWHGDGWEGYRDSPIARTPRRIHTVTVRVATEGRKGYALQFGPEDETVKLSVCEAIIPALRALLSIVSAPTSSTEMP